MPRTLALLVVLLITCMALVPACGPAAPAKLVTLRYDIGGMHCDGCVQAITAEVTKVKGVQRCDVSLDQRKATIEVTNASIAPEVEKAITKLGYTATRES